MILALVRKHEDAVEARLLGELAGVDLECGGASGPGFAQIAAVGGIADQRLVALLQLRIERGDDRLAVLAVVLGLRLVAADDVARALDLHLLDEQLRLARLALDRGAARRDRRSRARSSARARRERSRAPRMYSSLRSSSPAMVAAEIMPRSATTQTRPMEKRCRSRSITGNSVVTSAVLPGHISVQIGRPSPSTTRPRIICFRSGR